MAAEHEPTTGWNSGARLTGPERAYFRGRIGGVVGAGLFISFNDAGADGFVPVSSLGSDYFVYSDVTHSPDRAAHSEFPAW